MVLTDREIQTALETQQIIVDPPPLATAFSSTSLDLNLSKRIRVWKTEGTPGVEPQVFCPVATGYNFHEVVKKHSYPLEIGDEGYVMEPRAFILGWTAEEIELPLRSRIAARVEGKSSLARLGIGIHITAPTIHAGFRGPIQLEICNHGLLRVRLVPGMPVCQLIFEQTFGTPNKGYSGQFYGQKQT